MFASDVAALLVGQLPFRKKKLFWGERVIEWTTVVGTAEAGFLMSVALGLSPSGNGQKALKTLGEGFLSSLDEYFARELEGRGFRAGNHEIPNSRLSYHSAFAELVARHEPDFLVSVFEAKGTVLDAVMNGLVVGVKCPSDASHIVAEWVSPSGSYSVENDRVGIGGLTVELPRPGSVEQAQSILDAAFEDYEKQL